MTNQEFAQALIPMGIPSTLQALGCSLLGVGLSAFAYHLYLERWRPSDSPPLKSSFLPILGYALEIGKNPIEFFMSLKESFGEIFGIVVAGNRMYILTNPHDYILILRPNKDELSHEEFHTTVLVKFFGAKQKSLDNHAIDDDLMRAWFAKYLFSTDSLNTLTIRMQKHLNTMISRTAVEGTFPMYDFLGKIIFEASVVSLFNQETISSESDLYNAFMAFDKALPAAVAGVSVENISESKKGRDVLLKSCTASREDVSEFIDRRWKYFEQLSAENKIDGKDPTSFQLAMLWASVGNTMPAVFWIVYYLLKNPEAKQRVMEELGKVKKTQEGLIDQENLNSLVFVDACITESLRMSSGSMIMRYVKKPCKLTLDSGRTYSFVKGDRVGICPPLTHFDDAIFPNAKTFYPERFLDENLLDKSPLSRSTGKKLEMSNTFLPFGGGPTLCPGRRFARNEIKTLLVHLLGNFDLALADPNVQPGFDGSRAGLGIFPPKNSSVQIVVQKKVT